MRHPNPNPIPTLIMTGEHDGCIALDMFGATIHDEDFPPGALKYVVVPNAGHFVQNDQPDLVTQHILQFIKNY